MSMSHSKLIFLGPPGSGKGTQAKMLAKKIDLPHIAVGDLLREAVAKATLLGVEAKSFMDQGRLVPDALTIKLTEERLNRPDCEKGFILDGYPRSAAQAQAMDSFLSGKDYLVVYFSVQLSSVVERNGGRLSCACGESFHVKFKPPKKEGICDKCGEKLFQRSDDKPEVIKNRSRVYEENTAPLLDHYRAAGKLVQLDADAPIAVVTDRLEKIIGLK